MDAETLSFLVGLGASEEEAKAALAHTQGNPHAAADLLLGMTETQRADLVARMRTHGATSRTSPAEEEPCKMVLCVRQDLMMGVGENVCPVCSCCGDAMRSDS